MVKKIKHRNGCHYLLTPSYLLGAYDAASAIPYNNRFRPGAELAQYDYGFRAEVRGEHDNLDLSYEQRHK